MRKARLLFSILILIIIFYFLGNQIHSNWDKVREYSWNPHYGYLALSFFFFLTFNLIRAFLWKFVLAMCNSSLSYNKSLWIMVLSSIARYLPGKIWLFVGKVYLTMNEDISRKNASVAVIMELILTVVSAIFLILCFLSFTPQLNKFVSVYYYVIIIALGLVLLHSKSMNGILQLVSSITKRETEPFTYGYVPVLFTFVAFCFSWLWYTLGAFLLFKSFIALPFNNLGLFCCFIPLSWFVGLIAFFTPDGLGVREGVLAYSLKSSIPFSTGAILVIILRLWHTIIIDLLSLGIVLLFNKAEVKRMYQQAVQLKETTKTP